MCWLPFYIYNFKGVRNFVKSNGDTTVEKQGILNEREIQKIREFIKEHYKEMYLKWQELAETGYYGEE